MAERDNVIDNLFKAVFLPLISLQSFLCFYSMNSWPSVRFAQTLVQSNEEISNPYALVKLG